MSVTMLEVWVAQERHAEDRRFARKQREIAATLGPDCNPSLADRISGIKTQLQRWWTGSRADWPDRLPDDHLVTDA